MLNQEALAAALEREKTDLIILLLSEFWNTLTSNILETRTFQNDFYLISSELTTFDVINNLRNYISQIADKYGLIFNEKNNPYQTEFLLRLCYHDKSKCLLGEISIIVCQKSIGFRILPSMPSLKVFRQDEYVLVENIIQNICDELSNDNRLKFKEILSECNRIRNSSENLTLKTIEIAKTSIKTLYDRTDAKFKNIEQYCLYSSLLLNGRRLRIFHKEFLEDPNVLLKELKKQIEFGGLYVSKN